jgi:crotonobetainyl-CoA:carnitine CoA-transferase CaiB-like acyl-CoA transferase
MHDAVRSALDHRAFDRRQGAGEIRQPPSGFCAARLLSVRRRRQLDRRRVSSDAMWPKLAALLGSRDWASDSKLETAAGRRAIESEIEAAVAAWTSARDQKTP